VPTDKKFTGQRLDSTGLYYYNARYYDPQIGRFISPDTIIPNPANPQSFNRYNYCLNNPLKYVDPSGRKVYIPGLGDVESITMDSWIWLMHMTPEARGEVLTAVEAYSQLRGAAPELTNMMEGSEYLFTNIKTDFGNNKFGLPSVSADVYTDLRDEPMPVTYVPENSSSARFLRYIKRGGFTADPTNSFRAVIQYGEGTHSDWLGKTTREECFHRWDLIYTDPANIYRYYAEQIRLRSYYGSWEKAYRYSVYEQRAKVYAGKMSVLDVHLVSANDPWNINYWPFYDFGYFWYGRI
jgi:RHS repeat-associated protein